MERTEKWDRRYLAMTALVSSFSKDPSTQVGCIIVRPDWTLCSIGFNGFPMTMADHHDRLNDREDKLNRTLHAEINACIHSREKLDGYSLFAFPFMPCERCMVHLIQEGIARIVSIVPSEDKLARWGESFDRSRAYAEECGVEIKEYSFPDLLQVIGTVETPQN
jgi:dCMP deaminase